MSFKGIKSAIWSEYLNYFFNHIISETSLFLHIHQGTDSLFTGYISFVNMFFINDGPVKSLLFSFRFFRVVIF